MLTALAAVGKALIAPISKWAERREKRLDAENENRVRLLRDKQQANADWEMRGMVASGKALKWASFLMFSFPLIWAAFDPEAVRNYFEVSLAAVPEWWVQAWVMMTGSIWGISMLRDAAPQMVAGLRKAFAKTPPPPPSDEDEKKANGD